MPDISKIQIESGTYDIKDVKSRKNATMFPNFFVAPFFSGYGSAINKRMLRLYVSLDGINFNATDISATTIYDDYAGDVCLQYDKVTQTFFLSMTNYSEENDCIIYTSKDLKNWSKHKINLGYMSSHNTLHRWAPVLFIDDDENATLYLSLSVEYKKDDTKTYFKQILFKCNNKENLTFDKLGQILLSDKTDTSNYIDGTFAKKGNIYYFIVKHENAKAIELYSTSMIENINNYSLINESVALENVKLESPSITFTDTTANIYTENYIYRQGMNLQQCKLSDFPNISKNMRFLDSLVDDNNNNVTNESYNARHGNVVYITDENAKRQILNSCEIGFNSYNAIKKKDRNLYLKGIIDSAENGNKIVAYPNMRLVCRRY